MLRGIRPTAGEITLTVTHALSVLVEFVDENGKPVALTNMVAFMKPLDRDATEDEPGGAFSSENGLKSVRLRADIPGAYSLTVRSSDGHAEVFPGNYSRYKWKHDGHAPEQKSDEADAMKIRNAPKVEAKNDRESEKDLSRKRKRFQTLEGTIHSVEEMLYDFDARFAELDPSDYGPLSELTAEKEALQRDLEELYAEWEELSAMFSG